MHLTLAYILIDDYWHPRETITPVLPLILPDDMFSAEIFEAPEELRARLESGKLPGIIVNFKDGVANTQTQTPNWYDDRISAALLNAVKKGAGYLAVHCGMANVPESSPVYTELLRGIFITHPPACPVKFAPRPGHPITDGVSPFETDDEHYVVKVLTDQTDILGYSTSRQATNIALWAHEYGEGRVCGVTPGHRENTLLNPEYVKLLRNAVDWCARR
ncbi:MAG: ThuA domain-containing protein [Clostridiales bacterium]|jgi:type 1 glutamine amidotransferase|nr:ThuA domain-containing protein [Clostridiales bacterium]